MGAVLSLRRGEESAAGDGHLERIKEAGEALGHAAQRAEMIAETETEMIEVMIAETEIRRPARCGMDSRAFRKHCRLRRRSREQEESPGSAPRTGRSAWMPGRAAAKFPKASQRPLPHRMFE